MDAINFDIIAGQQGAEGYHCVLRYEPLGDAEAKFQIDPGEGPLASLLSWAASAVTESSANLDSAQELGHQLYQALFGGEAGEFLRSALQDAEDEGVPLRLRLSTKDLTLMSLPWEFLYDRKRERLFAVDQDTPLVRYLSDYATFGRPRLLAATLPLRLLMVVPAVEDLDVQGEIQRVQEALQKGKVLGKHVELVALSGADGPVTVEGLRDFLQEDSQGFDILHFSGHGDTKGGRGNIRFNDAAGGEKWVAGGTFARTLKPYTAADRPRPLRLVILNACEGGVSAPRAYGVRTLLGMAPALIQHGVPAVVAMQYQILDTAALAFARAFYRALVLGDTAGRVDAAVTDARQALETQFEGHRSFATPVLFLRAPGGVLFELAEASAEPEPTFGVSLDEGVRQKRRAEKLERERILALQDKQPGGSDQPAPSWRPPSGYDKRFLAWLDKHQLREDPFASTDADKETDILPFMRVEQPHVRLILKSPELASNHAVLAERGAGKSASRESMVSECLNDAQPFFGFPVRYTDFGEVLARANGDPARVSRRDHIEVIVRAGFQMLTQTTRPSSFETLSEDSRGLLLSMATAFADHVDRMRLGRLVPGPETHVRWQNTYDIRLFDHFVDLVRQLGPAREQLYRFVYVLVDPAIDNEAESRGALVLLKTLFSNGALLSRPGLGFKLFLPQDVGQLLLPVIDPDGKHFGTPVSITWDEDLLATLIGRRLGYFSNDQIVDMRQICTPDAAELLRELWAACERSPRKLLALCESLVHHHVARTEDEPRLEKEDFRSVLDAACRGH